MEQGIVLKGKDIVELMKIDMKDDLLILDKAGIKPCLAVIMVGDDPSAVAYVRMVERRANQDGLEVKILLYDEDISEQYLCDVVHKLNTDDAIHGILIQMPLPQHIDKKKIKDIIHPTKDVDGFHVVNAGRLYMGEQGLYPCTPYGIIHMLNYANIDIQGKHAVVIGRSLVVGRPIAMLLLEQNATVSICHSKTENLSSITKQADILIAAAGKKHMVTSDMVKKGAIVIDVGIHVTENGITGDVDFDDVVNVASQITPVPGGVGTTTLATLSWNTIKAAIAAIHDKINA